jgi:hypothetical protein
LTAAGPCLLSKGHEQLFWHWPVFFAQHFASNSEAQAVPLEEIIARAAVKALAMRFPAAYRVQMQKDRKTALLDPQPCTHRGDAFMAGFTRRLATISAGAAWV